MTVISGAMWLFLRPLVGTEFLPGYLQVGHWLLFGFFFFWKSVSFRWLCGNGGRTSAVSMASLPGCQRSSDVANAVITVIGGA